MRLRVPDKLSRLASALERVNLPMQEESTQTPPSRSRIRHQPKWQFNVDIVGSCNLSCPSCPVGNSRGINQPTRYMKPELLDRIVRKAKQETRGRIDFALYNWTEPLLHPDLPEMIRVVNGHGLHCGLSSNIQIVKDIDAIMDANPHYLKISVSGFTQETYGVTHRGGDIELVKENMRIVAEAKARAGATTKLSVPFHRYLGNHEDERHMREYAEELGFEFNPAWAYLMPLEKVLAFAEPAATDVRLEAEDRELIDRLALPLGPALRASKEEQEPYCKLRDQQMAITSEGDVMLCCAVYDQGKYTLGPFLDIPLEELQARKHRHDQCASCMKNGLHVLFTYGSDQLDRLALENVARVHPEAQFTAMRESRQRHRRGLRGWPRKLRKSWDRLAYGVRRRVRGKRR